MIDTSGKHNELIIDSINSVINQSFQNWELLVVVDNINRVSFACNHKRIRVVPKSADLHFVELINSLALEATGEIVTFITQGDLLSEYAVEYMTNCSDVKAIVTDEDYIDISGKRSNPFFKPELNLDYLLSSNYFSQAVAYNRRFFIELGGFDASVDDFYHAFALKAVANLDDDEIIHIDKVLFHLRQQKNPKNYRIQHDLPRSAPLVTVIVPTKDQSKYLRTCIDGLLNKTSYDNVEVIIIDNQSVQSETIDFFKEIQIDERVRIIKYNKTFNYSEMNNIAALHANGDLLCLLNNDISIMKDDWLTEMVSQAIRPDIGCVGAKLFYPDGTIQHGGVILGLKGYASHAHKGFSGDSEGYFNRLKVAHNVSAVTAACMVVRKELFQLVGGFDQINLKVAYNDIDFCLKVRKEGYRNLFTPHAQLVHHESKSRGKKRKRMQQKQLRAESDFFKKKWEHLLTSDPAYNANLTLVKEDFSLGFDRVQS